MKIIILHKKYTSNSVLKCRTLIFLVDILGGSALSDYLTGIIVITPSYIAPSLYLPDSSQDFGASVK